MGFPTRLSPNPKTEFCLFKTRHPCLDKPGRVWKPGPVATDIYEGGIMSAYLSLFARERDKKIGSTMCAAVCGLLLALATVVQITR